ncbi:hypothetical protein [Streptomyces alanosinicus]|uniref:hypothetical protein n=1 Tax=Streptomyces alanosinicus TaxID=68171 RepID=UPI001E3C4919|nr:hypothetical protein [Streptomyces alanosinicus]
MLGEHPTSEQRLVAGVREDALATVLALSAASLKTQPYFRLAMSSCGLTQIA